MEKVSAGKPTVMEPGNPFPLTKVGGVKVHLEIQVTAFTRGFNLMIIHWVMVMCVMMPLMIGLGGVDMMVGDMEMDGMIMQAWYISKIALVTIYIPMGMGHQMVREEEELNGDTEHHEQPQCRLSKQF